MGGMSGNTFALENRHKFWKYYLKLLLFLMDFAMINTWIYFKMANSEEAKSNESHADFFVQIATKMVQQNVEWAAKYKIRGNAFVQRSTRGTIATDNDSDAGILPCG